MDEIVVVSQIRKESLPPWLAMIVGGGDAGVTEAVDFGDDAANRFLELSAQLGVFYDGKSAGESGQVISFAGSHEGDSAVGDLLAKGSGKGVLGLSIEDEVTVDLVGDEYEIMAFAEVGEGGEFFFAEDSPDGVVWTAEDKDFGVGLDRGFHRVDVEGPAVFAI